MGNPSPHRKVERKSWLSDREHTVFQLMAKDYTPKEIKELMDISENSFRSSIQTVREWLETDTMTGALAELMRRGLIE